MPCPTCGSRVRIHNAEIREPLTLRSKLGFKQKRPGFKEPIYEEISGDDLHTKTGLWSHLLQVIDRQNNRYRKLVTNAETGEILRSVDEPLDEHTGRGSAKKPSSQK